MDQQRHDNLVSSLVPLEEPTPAAIVSHAEALSDVVFDLSYTLKTYARSMPSGMQVALLNSLVIALHGMREVQDSVNEYLRQAQSASN